MTQHSRRGTSLIELLVVLALLPAVLTIGAIATRRILTTESRLGTLGARANGIADALRTLARHVRTADPHAGDLTTAAGSTLDLTTTTGLASVCRIRGDTLFVTSGTPSSAWAGSLPRAITTTDVVRLWHDASATWIDRGVTSAGTSTMACGEPHAPWPGTATQRLLLSDSTPGLRPGSVVRVIERERWTLALSGDGSWSLTLADWNPTTGTFAVAQPLLSPLASLTAPGGAGFRIRARDASGTILGAGGFAGTRTIDVLLRSAPHARFGTVADSARIDVGTP